MDNEKRTYTFEGTVSKLEGHLGIGHCVLFPWIVEEEFGARGPVRILGTINGHEIDRALIPRGDGVHYLLISNELMKKIGLRPGFDCAVVIWKNENPNAIPLPEELEAAFDVEPDAKAAFDQQTPGTQRGICHWINSAKRPDTRAKRTAEVMARLQSRHFTLGNRKRND